MEGHKLNDQQQAYLRARVQQAQQLQTQVQEIERNLGEVLRFICFEQGLTEQYTLSADCSMLVPANEQGPQN